MSRALPIYPPLSIIPLTRLAPYSAVPISYSSPASRPDVHTARDAAAASTTARIVEMAPMIDAAMPAIWPMGSIAMALRFPMESPAWKKIEVCHEYVWLPYCGLEYGGAVRRALSEAVASGVADDPITGLPVPVAGPAVADGAATVARRNRVLLERIGGLSAGALEKRAAYYSAKVERQAFEDAMFEQLVAESHKP